MPIIKNNLWKIVFVFFVAIIALLGYKANRHRPVVAATVEHSAPPEHAASREEIEVIVKDFILNNPDILIKSIELMQQRKVKEMEEEVHKVIQEKKSEIEDITNAPYAGNKNGDVTIVAFMDPNCAYCKKFNDSLNQLLASDVGVKVIYKPFPILGEASEYTSRLLLAVYKTSPEKFKAVQDDVTSLPAITKEALKSVIEKNGLDMSNLEIEVDKPEIKEMQVKILMLSRDLHIQGAPASIINGTIYPGLLDINKLKEIVTQLRSGK